MKKNYAERLRSPLVKACVSLALICFPVSYSHAAGMITHAFMADYGRKALPEGPLKKLLTVHRPSLISGAIHPDGGYGSGTAFPPDREMAETAHWGDFTDTYVKYLRTQYPECIVSARAYSLAPQVNNPTALINPVGLADNCARLIAFMFGNAAHGLTDESWDSLFETNARERGEDPNPIKALESPQLLGPAFSPFTDLRKSLPAEGYNALASLFASVPLNALEYAGDVIGVVDHKIYEDTPLFELPPTDDLVKIFALYDKTFGTKLNVTREAIERAHAVTRGAVTAERAGANADYTRVRNQLPWLSNNYFTGPGGVADSGQMVAAMYQQWWEELVSTNDITSVTSPFIAGVHPKNGSKNVAVKKDAAGLNIHAFMGRNVKPSSVNRNTFSVLDESGNRVDGEVLTGIYNKKFTHLMRFKPAADLKKNHTYTVILSSAVTDVRDRKLGNAYVWRFTTAP